MSRRVPAWVWRNAIRDHAPFDRAMKATLYTLHAFMDRSGRAWPSQERVADSLKCSVRTVQRDIARARRAGWLLTEFTGEGKAWRRNAYVATVPDGVNLSETDEALADAADRQRDDTGQVADDTGLSSPCSHAGDTALSEPCIDADDTSLSSRSHSHTDGDDTQRHMVTTPMTDGDDTQRHMLTTQACRMKGSMKGSVKGPIEGPADCVDETMRGAVSRETETECAHDPGHGGGTEAPTGSEQGEPSTLNGTATDEPPPDADTSTVRQRARGGTTTRRASDRPPALDLPAKVARYAAEGYTDEAIREALKGWHQNLTVADVRRAREQGAAAPQKGTPA